MSDHTTRSETLTGAKALEYLERDKSDHHNRPIHQKKVEQYARIMAKGEWLLTPEPIVLDDNGSTILEGQHRLWALALAAESVPKLEVQFTVARGWNREIQGVIGSGLKRTDLDALILGDTDLEGLTNRHVACARTMAARTMNVLPVQITRHELRDFLARYYPGIVFAVSMALPKKRLGIAQASTHAVIAQAYYCNVDNDTLVRFGAILEGERAEEHEQPAHLLAQWLVKNALSKHKARNDVIYNKTQRALKSFIEKKPLATLYEATTQLFPLARTTRAERARRRTPAKKEG